jgi:hypothetical protein
MDVVTGDNAKIWVDAMAASSSLPSFTGVHHLLEFCLIRLGFP